jgi:hypothetical protein
VKARLRGTSIYYLVVLILVSVIYVASKPTYFSLSLANYNWTNIVRGNHLHEIAAWWIMTISIWLVLSLPVLFHLYKKRRPLFMPYLAGFCIGLGLSVHKSWQTTTAVAELLTALLYISGLCLLLSLYVPRMNTPMIRHGVYVCLSVYVFIWFFQSIGLGGMLWYLSTTEYGISFPSGIITEPEYGNAFPPLPYMFNVLQINFGSLLQLIPLTLVLLLSHGTRERGDGENSLPFTAWNKLLVRIQRKNPAHDTQPPGPERSDESRSSPILPLASSMRNRSIQIVS